jgi:sec-independent protein translocase protein TatC
MTDPRPNNIDTNDVRMTFGEHLEELRRRIIRALAGLAVGMIICLIWAQEFFSIVMRPAFMALREHGQNPALQSLGPPDSFLLYLKVALLCGMIISSPWILWQMWQFVAAGLYAHERRYVRLAIAPSFVLFFVGVSFMYFIVLPMILNFFVGFSSEFPLPDWAPSALERRLYGIEDTSGTSELPEVYARVPLLADDPVNPPPGSTWINTRTHQQKIQLEDGDQYVHNLTPSTKQTAIVNQYSIRDYASFVLRMSLAFGIAFQVPVVVLFLTASGLVPRNDLARMRRYVIFGFAVLSAILTPPDVISQILLAIPMVLLFEGGMIAAWLFERRGNKSDSSDL